MRGLDQDCVKQSLNGHPEAFGKLVQRYQGPLHSYLTGKLGDSERAEEAAQETFVRAFLALDRLRKAEAFFSWLLGIATRVVREQARADKRTRKFKQTSRRISSHPASGSAIEVETLRRAIAALPRAYAEVVLLRYYGGISCADVGRQLELPLGTVTKRLSRAYVMLREWLGRRDREHMENEASQ